MKKIVLEITKEAVLEAYNQTPRHRYLGTDPELLQLDYIPTVTNLLRTLQLEPTMGNKVALYRLLTGDHCASSNNTTDLSKNIILLIVTDSDFVLRPAPAAVKTSRPPVSNTIRVRATDQSQFLDSLLPRIYRQLFAQRHAGDYCLSELLNGAEYQQVRRQLSNSRVRLSTKEAIVMRLRQYINQHDLPYPGSWIRNA